MAKSRFSVRKLLRRAFLPVVSAGCVVVGVYSWVRVPSKARLASLTDTRDMIATSLDDSAAANELGADDQRLLRLLPSKLLFADYLERLHSIAESSGVRDLQVKSSIRGSRQAAEAAGLRGFSGTLRFEATWNDFVSFLSEIERGRPAMRVRSLLAEPTDSAIAVECVIDAWSMPVAEVVR